MRARYAWLSVGLVASAALGSLSGYVMELRERGPVVVVRNVSSPNDSPISSTSITPHRSSAVQSSTPVRPTTRRGSEVRTCNFRLNPDGSVWSNTDDFNPGWTAARPWWFTNAPVIAALQRDFAPEGGDHHHDRS